MKSNPLADISKDCDPAKGTVLVIGAGFGGIAAALRMRAKGFDVTLVDRLAAIGGELRYLNVEASATMLVPP